MTAKLSLGLDERPDPLVIRDARERANLTQAQAAQLVTGSQQASYRTWQNYEAAADKVQHRDIHPSVWSMFLLLTEQHPIYKLSRRTTPRKT